jgi:hypothetical protein
MVVSVKNNIVSVDGRQVYWAPFPVEQAIEDRRRIFLLFDGYQEHGQTASLYPHNVLCIDLHGAVRWKVCPAPGQAGPVTYVGIRLDGARLMGVALDGSWMEIDKETGQAASVPTT